MAFKFQLFSHDLGVDLGTSCVRIFLEGKGVVLREPSVIAMDKNSEKILQVGSAARNMLGRTPGNVAAMRPLKDGVVSDHEMTVRLLQTLFRNASKSGMFTPKPRVVISVPSGITEVEERTVINAAVEAGARRVYLIEEPLAAALGANLDIQGPNGHMIVNIGSGKTDIAVLSMNGVANAASVNVSGDSFDEAIAMHLRRKRGLVIGQPTAEEVKIQIGCVHPRPEDASMLVRGRDVNTGTPKEMEVFSSDVYEPLRRRAVRLAEAIQMLMDDTSPELVGDIVKNGITLTGGGCQLWGMDQMLSEALNVKCTIADDPESCVIYGCGKSLAWIHRMNEGPANIARQRILKA